MYYKYDLLILLPEDKDVDLFIDEIKKSIEFISNK